MREEEVGQMADPKIVHSGLMPSCENFGDGALVGFTEDLVNCPECLALWKAEGMPTYIARHDETKADFRRRTQTGPATAPSGCQ